MALQPVPPIQLVDAAEMQRCGSGAGLPRAADPHAPIMHTRGLCISTITHGQVRIVKVQQDQSGRLGVADEQARQVQKYTMRWQTIAGNVKALLILVGMATPTASSVIAHEMMHAWLCQNGFRGSKQLSRQVEEGLCQLMAHLWLTQRPFPVRMHILLAICSAS